MVVIDAQIKMYVDDNDFKECRDIALEVMGLSYVAESKKNITAWRAVDTGRLRRSINYKTRKTQIAKENPEDSLTVQPKEGEVCIGTNVSYAGFVEYGSGAMPPRPFLRYTYDSHTPLAQQRFQKEFVKQLVTRSKHG